MRRRPAGVPVGLHHPVLPVIGALAYVVAVTRPGMDGQPAGPADAAARRQHAQSREALPRTLRRAGDRRHDREPRGARRGVPRAGEVRGGEAAFRRHPGAPDGRRAALHARQGARRSSGSARRPTRSRRSTSCAQRWPDYQSAEAHLLYARALEETGRGEEALAEYRALSEYFVGAEARVRYGLLLARMGREGEAKAWLARRADAAAARRPNMCARRRPNGSRSPKRRPGLSLGGRDRCAAHELGAAAIKPFRGVPLP